MTYSTTTISSCIDELNKSWFLPSIQRPFVWEPDQIIRLFDSLLKGLPISTFLVWALKKETASSWDTYKFLENFRHGDVHNARVDLSDQDVTLVLDGQQRLTSLLIGFSGSYTVKAKYARKKNMDAWSQKWLYLDLLKSPEELSSDELDSDIGVTYGLAFHERDQRVSPEHYWFRISRIQNVRSEEEFDALHEDVMQYLPAGATRMDRKIVERNLERLWKVFTEEPVISFFTETHQSLDRVLNIFIRANDAGTKLSKSDLLMTMATSKWRDYNARDEVFNFVDQLNDCLKMKNKVTKDFVLKACLVLNNLEVAYRVDNFTNANLETIEISWPSIKKSLTRTLELVNAFGIDKSTLTSTNALMPIAYFLHRVDKDLLGSTPEETSNRKYVHRFLLGALINGAFSGTSDRAISGCRGVLRDHLRASSDFPLLKLVEELGNQGRLATFNTDNLRRLLDLTYRDKRCFLGLSLLYAVGKSDAERMDIDHIIPQAKTERKVLEGLGLTRVQIAEIEEASQKLGNLQLLLTRENIEKSDTPFNHWVETRDDDFLERHCLPRDRGLWRVESLPEFVAEREKLIAKRIKQTSPALSL
ncbi:DUF262 domain-containing protein [Rhodalgimonas zhirmunskyi]|uniref:DUF262 domain-containing HNH endonuclease family protein n=1 Tax=Rhodalgimonas zhirmunskyi TaxID=2964767 RepID=A0AAJ1U8M6_9RHOB|nr:DUF262 domain-containing protein [Rhodoalgimonas zhirmunskyi]MDQ2095635.1 DUF262 domain-containing HNH endonuclease family protein [Rhodoalgimonas zhirmunskyi]